MSLYDKASLVQIPSGTKAGTLYSVLPANGDGDFDHTRATSATRVNKDGLIESVGSNVPRLDYPLIDGVVQDCPALLLEPSRTNVMTDSELSTSTIVNSGDGVSSDITLSNGLSGKKFSTTSSGRSFAQLTASVSSGVQYTFSAFVENFTGDTISNFVDITSGGGGEDFSSNLIENGKIKVSFTTTSTSVQIRIGIGCTSTLSGTRSAEISGVQLETGSYATSYIPTSGSAVTRNADVCNGAGTSAEFNDSEGVLFAEIAALANDGTIRRLAIANSAATGLHRIELSSTDNQVFGVTYISPSNQAAISYTLTDVTTFFKIAYKYKANDFALWINGVEVGVDPSGSVPTGLTKLNFDNGSGGNDFYGKVKQLMVFNEALTDAELQTLTSL